MTHESWLMITSRKSPSVLRVAPLRWLKTVFHLKSWTIWIHLRVWKIFMKLKPKNAENLSGLYLLSSVSYCSLTPNHKLGWLQASDQATDRGQLPLPDHDGWSSSCPPQDRASTRCTFVTEPFQGRKTHLIQITSAKGMVRLNRSQMSIILTYDVFGRALDTLMNLFGKRA